MSPTHAEPSGAPERIVLAADVHLLPYSDIWGTLIWEPSTSSLVFQHTAHAGAEEVLSTGLIAYGYLPEPGNCFIKNWSEHLGITASLAEQHLISVVREVRVGEFRSAAFEVEIVLPDGTARMAACARARDLRHNRKERYVHT